MSEWLEILVALTISGSIVVIGMLLLRLCLPHAFTAKWQYLIGKTALLFYLLPVVFVMQRLPLSTSEAVSNAKGMLLEHEIAIVPKAAHLPAAIGLAMLSIWAVGAVVFAGWHIYCFFKFTKRIKTSSLPIPQSSEITQLANACQRRLGISGNVRLAYNREVASPVLVGLFKPTILLPIGSTSGVDLGMVIHHELIHWKRKDLWIKMLSLFAGAIHWFNPFVHMLRKDIHIWSELSCDEEVVKEMSHTERKRYGETILNLMEDASEMPAAFCASLSEHGMQLKQRLIRLLNVKRRSRLTVITTCITVMAIGGLGTTAAAWAAEYIPAIESTVLEDQRSESPVLVQTEYVENIIFVQLDSEHDQVHEVLPSDEILTTEFIKKIELNQKIDSLDTVIVPSPSPEVKIEQIKNVPFKILERKKP